MKRAFALSVSLLAVTWATTALAAPPQLKGQYGFTGMATCQYTGQQGFSVTPPILNTSTNPPHFDNVNPPNPTNMSTHTTLFTVPNVVPPNTPNGVFSNTFSVQGVRTFDGHGHGHVSGTSVEITNVTAQPRAGASRFEADFTYTIDDAGLLTVQLGPNGLQGTDLNLDGSDSPSTWTVDHFTLAGLIGNNNSTITLSTVTPEIETQTFIHGPQTGTSRQRICTRSRTLMWLGN